jgi:hypothetical protein
MCLAQSEIRLNDQDERKLIIINDKQYIDTAWSSSVNPDSIFVYYYSIRSKYPQSSESIRAQSISFLKKRGVPVKGSGYLTYRFFIDSTGRMQKRVQVLQTNETYKKYIFYNDLIWGLFDYLETLKQWKPAKVRVGYPPFYIGIMTFKIHEDSIVAVIP